MDSLKGFCSCPDWAVPCKHIAAVIYLLSEEIDVNPFLIFELHGMDLPGEIKRATAINVQELTNKQLFPRVSSADPICKPPTHDALLQLLDMDLSRIPELGTQIGELLPRQPLLHSTKDFHEILQTHYHRTAVFTARFDASDLLDDHREFNTNQAA